MTLSQKRRVQQIRESYPRSHCASGNENDYEVKRWEVDGDTYRHTSVIIETGRIGDEGTAAAILARNYAHFLIGPRGGMTVHTYLASKPVTYKGRDVWVHCLNRPYR